jgi:hypothetical protein
LRSWPRRGDQVSSLMIACPWARFGVHERLFLISGRLPIPPSVVPRAAGPRVGPEGALGAWEILRLLGRAPRGSHADRLN